MAKKKPKGRTALVMKKKAPVKHMQSARAKLAATDRYFGRKYTKAQALADYRKWAVNRFGAEKGKKMANDVAKMNAADAKKKAARVVTKKGGK